MFFITFCNLEILISVLIFTFYFIPFLSIIPLPENIMHFLIFRIEYCLPEVLEQPEGGTPILDVMAICDRHHTNASKQRTLLDDVNFSSALCPNLIA